MIDLLHDQIAIQSLAVLGAVGGFVLIGVGFIAFAIIALITD